MAARYSRVDYRRFASIIRAATQRAEQQSHQDTDAFLDGTEMAISDIANAIAYEFEKDNPGKTGFNRKQFFALAGANDPKGEE